MAKIKVDFTDMKEFADITSGKYIAKIKSWSMEEGEKAPYILWKLQIASGEAKGSMIDHRTSLSPKALFGLRDMLVAFGINVPKSAIAVDPDKFIGRNIGIEIVMRPWDGKEYPNVKKVFAATKTTDVVKPSVVDEDEVDLDDDITMEL